MSYVAATNWADMKTNIDNLIDTNGAGGITGAELNDILNNMVDLTEDYDEHGDPDLVALFEATLT